MKLIKGSAILCFAALDLHDEKAPFSGPPWQSMILAACIRVRAES
jgi:hypothetical protein